MNSEPALSIGGVVAAVEAGVVLLVSFGFDISDGQKGAIIAFATVVLGLLSSVLLRMHVFAPTTVEKITAGGVTTAAAGNPPLGAGGIAAGPFAPAAAVPTSAPANGAGVLVSSAGAANAGVTG